MPIHLDQVKKGAILEDQHQPPDMAGDMFGTGRLAMPFDITKRAVLLDLPEELMPSVKATVESPLVS